VKLRALARITGLALAAYAGVLAWVYWRQESLLFRPEPLPTDFQFSAPDVREVRIEVPGAVLSALHMRLPNPKGVVFFLHGNGGNLATWFTNSAFYRSANYDLFMIDYRGYGKSTGRIESEAQLRSDVRAAWDFVAPQYEGRRKVIHGRSLGTALAAGLAADVQPDLTVLVSPYCSMAELSRVHYPLVPTLLLRYELSTCDAAARIATPLLLMHGDRDILIPASQGQRVQTYAPRAELLIIPGAGHDDVHLFADYRDSLMERLKAL
jgi:uncharacterized protein